MTQASGKGRNAPTRTGGFTLVELAIVVLIIGLLAGIAIPNLQRAVLRARAAEVVGDMHLVRLALLGYAGDHHGYPTDGALGEVPDGLEPYLPDNFSFERDGYQLDYDDWRGVIAVAAVTEEPDLALAVLDMLGNDAWAGGMDTWVSLVVDWSQ